LREQNEFTGVPTWHTLRKMYSSTAKIDLLLGQQEDPVRFFVNWIWRQSKGNIRLEDLMKVLNKDQKERLFLDYHLQDASVWTPLTGRTVFEHERSFMFGDDLPVDGLDVRVRKYIKCFFQRQDDVFFQPSDLAFHLRVPSSEEDSFEKVLTTWKLTYAQTASTNQLLYVIRTQIGKAAEKRIRDRINDDFSFDTIKTPWKKAGKQLQGMIYGFLYRYTYQHVLATVAGMKNDLKMDLTQWPPSSMMIGANLSFTLGSLLKLLAEQNQFSFVISIENYINTRQMTKQC